MAELINWYPGHMKKTRELIQANLKLVEAVIEVVDARIPLSSRNPIIDELVRDKKRILILNKSDLADAKATADWIAEYKEAGHLALSVNAMTGSGIPELLRLLETMEAKNNAERVRKRPLRLMIVGVPNVGKSSLINRLTAKKSAATGDRPGITKGKQWLTVGNGMQLLDTPGILWPKFEDPEVGLHLAFCGSVKDEIMDLEGLALQLVRELSEDYPELIKKRYGLTELFEEPLETMEAIAQKRGFILPGKRIDYERTARTLLDEFRSGIIGKITFERREVRA
ncbi:MAG: ribosome biogenesis GTPase YlqF [Eubacteriales bacterium]|nr:ribosome biogenesis GTPase YlqF [Eubacteriales bacterium]MDD3349651.1 ribosome biogenesis GTPase YlqF [Eubacteriales bacterium]